MSTVAAVAVSTGVFFAELLAMLILSGVVAGTSVVAVLKLVDTVLEQRRP